MRISVIIPTFGKPVFLRNTIESVLSQTYTDWELIVVDDNNPDSEGRKETEVLLSEYIEKDYRIQYIKHPKNLNGSVARNTGFNVAKGEYISLLDSDDEYMPTRLEKCLEAMEGEPDNIAGVYTCCEFRRKGKTYYTSKTAKTGNFLIQSLSCTFGLCTGSNIFVRKNVVDELNGFDPAFRRHQDYDFMTRLFEKYSLKGLDEVLVIKNNENFNLPDVDKMIEIKTDYLHKFENILIGLSEVERNQVNHSHNIQIAEAAISTKRYRLAKKHFLLANSQGKISVREYIKMIALFINNYIRLK